VLLLLLRRRLLLLLLLLPFWSDGLRVLVVVWTTGRLIHDCRVRVSIDQDDNSMYPV
jgi:hypothetical protein